MNATIATMAVVSMANVEIQLEAIPVYAILGMKVMAEFAEVYMMSYSNKQIHKNFSICHLQSCASFANYQSSFFSFSEQNNMTMFSIFLDHVFPLHCYKFLIFVLGLALIT